jgi:hypothetical protein
MNNEDVKRLAREIADKDKVDPVNSQGDMITLFPEELMRLIDFIRAEEREACAELADEFAAEGYGGHKIAKAIRARGEVK